MKSHHVEMKHFWWSLVISTWWLLMIFCQILHTGFHDFWWFVMTFPVTFNKSDISVRILVIWLYYFLILVNYGVLIFPWFLNIIFSQWLLGLVQPSIPLNWSVEYYKLGPCPSRGALVHGMGLLSQGLRLSGTQCRFTHSKQVGENGIDRIWNVTYSWLWQTSGS